MNPITPSHSPRPRARRRVTPFFTCCLRRGTFVSSDKSTQKRRLKLRFKTSSARCARCQTCLIFLAQSPFPCFVVGQKDCAATAFRCRFAAAACCHGRSFPLYRRNLERISPFRHAAPVRACHSEPVRRLVWQSVSPVPAPAGAEPFFTCCLRRGTFVSSDKSTQKRRLKLRFKTSLARFAL